ncbi:hypothetical protein MMC25_003986 [Agyrium rufum]|nr:hypothetical protein [Agyrium rufum]
MAARPHPPASRKRKRESLPEADPYVLTPLLKDIPLSANGDDLDVRITCVEYWDGNLYIGTSIGQLLHFVSIPGDEAQNVPASFILATRLDLPRSTSPETAHGVQRILLLPRVNKACILCDGIVAFYTLPELSPVRDSPKISISTWIGGQDLDRPDDEDGDEYIMLALRSIVRVIRVPAFDKPAGIQKIEYPGCLSAVRRGRFACIADSKSYALIDIQNQQKIPLFSISSIDESAASVISGPTERLAKASEEKTGRSTSNPAIEAITRVSNAHNRGTSVGAFLDGKSKAVARTDGGSQRSRSREDLKTEVADRRSRNLSPMLAQPSSQLGSGNGTPAQRHASPEKPLPKPPSQKTEYPERTSSIPPQKRTHPLKPHTLSPSVAEFLLITGTRSNEPGVGIFVNLDGDVVRGTLEFSQYPSAVLIDASDPLPGMGGLSDGNHSEDYVVASISRVMDGKIEYGVEFQKWNSKTPSSRLWKLIHSEPNSIDQSLERQVSKALEVGLVHSHQPQSQKFEEVGRKLRSRRFRFGVPKRKDTRKSTEDFTEPVEQGGKAEGWEIERDKQEDEFAARLGQSTTRLMLWSGATIQWAIRNPELLRTEGVIDQVVTGAGGPEDLVHRLVDVLESINEQEARDETGFLSLQYVKQKVAIHLFSACMQSTNDEMLAVAGPHLIEGSLDPRVLISTISFLHPDVFEGRKGIWIHAGLINLMNSTSEQLEDPATASNKGEPTAKMLEFVGRFLAVWRKRKGYGSVPDEAEVFSTVDAALLHILLELDQRKGGGSKHIRAELYLVVDQGVESYDRGVELLEQYKRLFVLSRLYHGRKHVPAKVLETFRRILDGEYDAGGGEFLDGEQQVRKYLTGMKDLGLVEEYGTWLANRNPTLGVRVFTDDAAKIKLPPNQVVQLLKLKAPDAVKVYLEHLVFDKKNVQYANDLISYYLDSVIEALNSNDEARATLAQSYETYRALHAPKPTYRQFITDNAVPIAWWHDRLRLLELIGGHHGAGFSYDVASVLKRIQPFEQDLVPESIILDGRQGHHEQALRLLTHGLGDFHTAVNYCLLGGSSIFHPTSGLSTESIPSREQQADLFHHLFAEFLKIEDEEVRIEQTSQLLARFGGWFDIAVVLTQIPDGWTVDTLLDFLVSAMRRLLQDKSEATIAKALSGAENLQVSVGLIEKFMEAGPVIQTVEVEPPTG